MGINRGVNTFIAIGSLALGIAIGYFAMKPDVIDYADGFRYDSALTKQPELDSLSSPVKSQSVQGQREQSVAEKRYLHSGVEAVDFLAKAFANGEYPESEMREIRRKIRANPELGYQLLELYPALENREVRDAVKRNLAMANFTNGFFLERHILEKIAQDTVSIDSWGLLAEWGVHTKDGIDYFTDQLQFQSDPRKLQASARALSKASGFGSMQMNQSMIEEVTQRFNQLREHHDEHIRAAAVASYDTFTPIDIEQRLVTALSDPSAAIRSSALNVATGRLQSSKSVGAYLLRNMRDSELPVLERQMIGLILMSSNSSELDINEVSRTLDEIKMTLAAFSPEELQLMRDSWIRELEPELR